MNHLFDHRNEGIFNIQLALFTFVYEELYLPYKVENLGCGFLRFGNIIITCVFWMRFFIYQDVNACHVINPDHIAGEFDSIGGLESINKHYLSW